MKECSIEGPLLLLENQVTKSGVDHLCRSGLLTVENTRKYETMASHINPQHRRWLTRLDLSVQNPGEYLSWKAKGGGIGRVGPRVRNKQ